MESGIIATSPRSLFVLFVLLVPCWTRYAAENRARTLCTQTRDPGPCRADITSYYFNRLSMRCEEFSYGGCEGNDNNFETFRECKNTCRHFKKVPRVCREDAESGPCRGSLHQYFYNMSSGLCEEFIYGGCFGNENRFQTFRQCKKTCLKKSETPSFCEQSAQRGNCLGSFERFYFDPSLKICRPFTYSGCGGNDNNFATVETCLRECNKV
uniref:Tissue factor pathway inhibitor 2 n=1 Tax=Eptatretus burgeri TaxID=7764 RepID=A0A8C4X1L0_EPTBU